MADTKTLIERTKKRSTSVICNGARQFLIPLKD